MGQFINDIATALKAYGVSKGYTLSDQFYNDMAWGGLTHLDNNVINPKFTEIVLSNAARQRILNTIDAEAENETAEGVTPKGSPCE